MQFKLIFTFFATVTLAFAPDQLQLFAQDSVTIVANACSENDILSYARGKVDFQTFTFACFEEIEKRRYSPDSLQISNAHVVREDVITRIKWELVTHLSGIATDNMKMLPWSRMSRLFGLKLDFEQLEGADAFPPSVASSISQTVREFELISGRRYSETIAYLFARLGRNVSKLTMRGTYPRGLDNLARYFSRNPNIKSVTLSDEDDLDCSKYFEVAAAIRSNAESVLESLSISCTTYGARELESLFESSRATQQTTFILKTGSKLFGKWMEKMIAVGDAASKKQASVSMLKHGINGSALVSFAPFQPPTYPLNNEVKKVWFERMIVRVEMYSDEPEFLRIFQFLYAGFYGPVRGIEKSQVEQFFAFLGTHPI